MKKLIIILALLLITTPSFSATTHDGKVDWNDDYFGIDVSLVDNIFIEPNFKEGFHSIRIVTRREAFNVPEFFGWVSSHNRPSDYSGSPAKLDGSMINLDTSYLSHAYPSPNVCNGQFFVIRQLEVGIKGKNFPNRGTTNPQNLPCFGTSEGFESYSGEAYINVAIVIPDSEYDKLVVFAASLDAYNNSNTIYQVDKDLDSIKNKYNRLQLPSVGTTLYEK